MEERIAAGETELAEDLMPSIKYGLMGKADVFDRFNDDWLRDTNKSVANHYTKMLTIARSGFEY